MDGRLEKMEKDYAEEGKVKIQEAKDLAAAGKVKQAVEEVLLPFEKDTRMAGDMATTSLVLVTIVELCFEAKEFTYMNDNMTLLAKKRSLIKASVGKMVKKAYEYVEQTPDLETKIKGQVLEFLKLKTFRLQKTGVPRKELPDDGNFEKLTLFSQTDRMPPRNHRRKNLRRTRKSPSNPQTSPHSRKRQQNQRSLHRLTRFTSRNLWLHGPQRKMRIHFRANAILFS